MSKGSSRRPQSVTNKQFESNWDRLFSKKEPEVEHWNTRDTCPNCGEYLVGDGYSNGDPVRCPNALEEDWWYSEPDSGPWYCNFEEEEE